MRTLGEAREFLGGISEFTFRSLMKDIYLKPYTLTINGRKAIRFDTQMLYKIGQAKGRREAEKLRKRISKREAKLVPWKPKKLNVEETIEAYKNSKYFDFFSKTFGDIK
mgnify:CR=1 FL=1